MSFVLKPKHPITTNVSSTMTVDSDGFTAIVSCRFVDTDSPEYGQPYHDFACKFLSKFIIDKIKIWGVDKYGRCLVDAFAGDKNVGEEMVRAGLAWAISPKYRQLEREARRAKRGLWKEENPVPPWEYRDKHERVSRKDV